MNYCTDTEVLILGDFNLPYLRWESDLPVVYIPRVNKLFSDLFIFLGITRWVHRSTFVISGTILDLILSSEVDKINEKSKHMPSFS